MTRAARAVHMSDHDIRVLSSGLSQGDEMRHFTCLHGLVDTLDIWKRLVPDLETRGRVTRLDQRGHGQSGAPPGPYTRADLASDVAAVLDAEGIDQTILVGHSMGGIVAMETALLYPDRIAGLVLIGTTSECREKIADWYERSPSPENATAPRAWVGRSMERNRPRRSRATRRESRM